MESEAARHHQERAEEGQEQDQGRGGRDLHAQGDEEEGDEEVADVHDLRDHVEVVGEGGHAHPGHERAHLPRQAQEGRRPRSPGSTRPARSRAAARAPWR